MTYTEADVPLRAPRLLQLSANVVAAHTSTLLARPKHSGDKQEQDQEQQQHEPAVSSDNDSMLQLPIPASSAVFGALREQWIKTVSISMFYRFVLFAFKK